MILGLALIESLVLLAFVIAGTWLIATSAHLILGGILLGFGIAVMLLHVALDAIRRWR
jgi:hypothetical protein